MIDRDTGILPASDMDKLSQREKTEYRAWREQIEQALLEQARLFQERFPGLKVDFRFQCEVYVR